MVVFFTKNNENTYQQGRSLVQVYRVVPQTKRKNSEVKNKRKFKEDYIW